MESDSERPAYEPVTVPQGPTDGSNEAKIASVNRLIEVFTNPTAVFEDIARKPTILVVFVCMVMAIVGNAFIIAKNTDFEANAIQGIEMIGIEVPEDQLERQIESSEDRWFLRPVMTAIFSPIIYLIATVVFFLMLKLTGSQINFKSTLSTVLHAYWPAKLVSMVLLSMLVIRHGAVTDMALIRIFKSSLAGFLPESTSWPVLTLASFVDVFRIWGIVLLAIGFVIVARISNRKSWTAVLVPWVVLALLSAGMVALPSLFMG